MLPFSQFMAFGVNNYPAVATPAIAFRAGYSDGTNASSYTFTGCDFGADDATREIFVVINLRFNAVARSISSVTIGGVTATVESQINNGVLSGVTVARAVIASGATGAVVVTLSGTVLSCAIAVYRASNRPAFGTGASEVASSTFSAAASTNLTGIDVSAFGFVLSSIVWNNTVSASSFSGLGGGQNIFMEPDTGDQLAFGSTPLQASASTGNTLTWTWTTSRSGQAAAWAF